jgi:hypothetical protein
MLKMSGFCSLSQACSRIIQTPPPAHRGAGRITVDAREKGLTPCILHYAMNTCKEGAFCWEIDVKTHFG